MLRVFATAFCALLLLAGLAPIAASATGATHITTVNDSDAFVWITAYEGSYHTGSAHAWCVKPHSRDTHGVAVYIFDVRAELSHGGCQRHILLDVTRNAVRGLKHGDYFYGYRATGTGSGYQFNGPL